MWVARTSIEDETAGYRLSICLDAADAKEEAALIEQDHQPERGVIIDCFTLQELFWTVGAVPLDQKVTGLNMIPHLKSLLIYCTPKAEEHLLRVLLRMSADMNVGLMMNWVEGK